MVWPHQSIYRADVDNHPRPLPDHHLFTREDLAAAAREAERRSAVLVVTEKDAAKIAPDWAEAFRVWVLLQEVRLSAGEDRLEGLLDRVLREDERSPAGRS